MAHDSLLDVDRDALSPGEKVQYAQVLAMLSISQELSKIHHEGINPEYVTF